MKNNYRWMKDEQRQAKASEWMDMTLHMTGSSINSKTFHT
jgi:hypothetical protein